MVKYFERAVMASFSLNLLLTVAIGIEAGRTWLQGDPNLYLFGALSLATSMNFYITYQLIRAFPREDDSD